MKLGALIKILQNAKKDFGDVDVQLMDSDTGRWNDVQMVIKLHPFTDQWGCLNRAEPVNAVGILDVTYKSDLNIHPV